MGYYINPEDMSKEEWLLKHGVKMTVQSVQSFEFKNEFLPVCLLDNFAFTAAGIAYDQREALVFMRDDGRPRQWFLVSKDDLKPWYQENKVSV